MPPQIITPQSSSSPSAKISIEGDCAVTILITECKDIVFFRILQIFGGKNEIFSQINYLYRIFSIFLSVYTRFLCNFAAVNKFNIGDVTIISI